jgi:hypothetical protein
MKLLSCRETTRLISQGCRRASRQLAFLRRAVRALPDQREESS